jgi:hypothetical protein
MMMLSSGVLRYSVFIAFMTSSTLASATSVMLFSKTPKKTTASAASSTTTQTIQGVKWHPGNYLLTYITTSDAEMPNIIATLPQGFRGIQRRYTWKSLEPTQGQYNFTSIATDLTNLAKIGKKLVLQVSVKSHNDVQYGPVIPDYLLNSTYEGGAYITQTGTNPTYWNASLQTRLIALFNALGSQFDLNTNLEAIVLNDETAPSVTNPTYWNPIYLDNYITGTTKVALAAKAAFPHTVVMQYINYPTSALPTLVSSLKNAGIGVGGPDVLTEDTGLINGSYPYIKGVANQVPIGMAVQYEDYSARYHGGPYNPPGIPSLYQFSQQQLQTNYIFWLRRTAESASASNDYHASNYYQDLLNYMSTITWTANPAGGLSTTCPSMLSACDIK